MSSSVITIGQLGPELLALSREMKTKADRALRRAAHRAVAEVVKEIDGSEPYAPVDTGELRRSNVVMKLAPGEYVVENVAPHAAHQEHGTRPFVPPAGPLRAWARRKARAGRGASRRKSAEQLFRRARYAIATRGIRAKAFWARASQRFPDIVEQELVRRLREVR